MHVHLVLLTDEVYHGVVFQPSWVWLGVVVVVSGKIRWGAGALTLPFKFAPGCHPMYNKILQLRLSLITAKLLRLVRVVDITKPKHCIKFTHGSVFSQSWPNRPDWGVKKHNINKIIHDRLSITTPKK